MINRLKQVLGGKPAAKPSSPVQPIAALPLPIDVTDADFGTVVDPYQGLAVVDFWADWCEPCKIMSVYVSFLAADFAGRALIAALDADENPNTSERFQIMGLPTLLFLRNGQEIDRIVGVESYDAIKQRVATHLSK